MHGHRVVLNARLRQETQYSLSAEVQAHSCLQFKEVQKQISPLWYKCILQSLGQCWKPWPPLCGAEVAGSVGDGVQWRQHTAAPERGTAGLADRVELIPVRQSVTFKFPLGCLARWLLSGSVAAQFPSLFSTFSGTCSCYDAICQSVTTRGSVLASEQIRMPNFGISASKTVS